MSEYAISQIYPSDRRANTQINELLLAEGIQQRCQSGLHLRHV